MAFELYEPNIYTAKNFVKGLQYYVTHLIPIIWALVLAPVCGVIVGMLTGDTSVTIDVLKHATNPANAYIYSLANGGVLTLIAAIGLVAMLMVVSVFNAGAAVTEKLAVK